MHDNVKEQVEQLKMLTQTTGGLHEAQVVQLKMWPLLLFNDIKSAECLFEFEQKTVTYNIVSTSSYMRGDKAAKVLAKWTQDLLGTIYTVIVKVQALPMERLTTIYRKRGTVAKKNGK